MSSGAPKKCSSKGSNTVKKIASATPATRNAGQITHINRCAKSSLDCILTSSIIDRVPRRPATARAVRAQSTARAVPRRTSADRSLTSTAGSRHASVSTVTSQRPGGGGSTRPAVRAAGAARERRCPIESRARRVGEPEPHGGRQCRSGEPRKLHAHRAVGRDAERGPEPERFAPVRSLELLVDDEPALVIVVRHHAVVGRPGEPRRRQRGDDDDRRPRDQQPRPSVGGTTGSRAARAVMAFGIVAGGSAREQEGRLSRAARALASPAASITNSIRFAPGLPASAGACSRTGHEARRCAGDRDRLLDADDGDPGEAFRR